MFFWGEGSIPLGFRPNVTGGTVNSLNWITLWGERFNGDQITKAFSLEGKQSGGKAGRFYMVVSRVQLSSLLRRVDLWGRIKRISGFPGKQKSILQGP